MAFYLPNVNGNENRVVVDKFGPGLHGHSDVKPNRTRHRAYMGEMYEQSIVRAVRGEIPLGTVDDPRYDQLADVIYGIVAGQAAIDLSYLQDDVDIGVYSCGCKTNLGTASTALSIVFAPGYTRRAIADSGAGAAFLGANPGDPVACVDMVSDGVCVVGTGGSVEVINPFATSTDGVSGTTENFNDVAYGDGILIAAAENGVARRSTDNGLTWSDAKPIGSSADDFSAVVWAGGSFCLFQITTNKVYVSEDGLPGNWIERISGNSLIRRAAYCEYSDTVYVLGGLATISYSSDLFETTSSGYGMPGYVSVAYDMVLNDDGRTITVAGQHQNGDGFFATALLEGVGNKWVRSTMTKLIAPGCRGFFAFGRHFWPDLISETVVSKRAWRGF